MRMTLDRVWYRRAFTVPQEWQGRRLLLHFGAVDWQAQVWVNGQAAGEHTGGYDAFSLEITPYLQDGENELVVGVFDPTQNGEQPIGKQTTSPGDIWYTGATGIWQTVWLEPVPETAITRLKLVPDLPGQALGITVMVDGPAEGVIVEAAAFAEGQEASRTVGAPGEEIRLDLPNPRPWSPDDPFLYDLTVTLKQGDTIIDEVQSYFGMRSIEIEQVDGIARPVLNGEFVFQIGLLDQGYWPDGIYTAPTDEALRFDLEQAKALGYNMVRKHMKVEPQRWYYWADRLGLLVWQDMPSMNPLGPPPSPDAREQFERELIEMVDELSNSPAIVMWVAFNEGWGEYNQSRIAGMIKSWDPTRLVNNASGWNDAGAGDIIDVHDYERPSAPRPEPDRASVLGEYGGLGLHTTGRMWARGGFAYKRMKTTEELTSTYLDYLAQIQELMETQALSAAVYTQITDVEGEINGIMTYDRAVLKLDAEAARAAHEALIEASRREMVR
jgi:beta-galactosidase/beta-glucuronidase